MSGFNESNATFTLLLIKSIVEHAAEGSVEISLMKAWEKWEVYPLTVKSEIRGILYIPDFRPSIQRRILPVNVPPLPGEWEEAEQLQENLTKQKNNLDSEVDATPTMKYTSLQVTQICFQEVCGSVVNVGGSAGWWQRKKCKAVKCSGKSRTIQGHKVSMLSKHGHDTVSDITFRNNSSLWFIFPFPIYIYLSILVPPPLAV